MLKQNDMDGVMPLAERSLELTGKTYPLEHPLVLDRTLRLASALAHSTRTEAKRRCDQVVGIMCG